MNNSGKKRISGGMALHTALFVLADAVLINAAAFLALFLRYELSYAELAKTVYLHAIAVTAAPGTLLCLGAFFTFHIYSSMWEFAGEHELLDLLCACVIGAVLYMMAAFLLDYQLPWSFPFLFAIVLFVLAAYVRLMVNWAVKRKYGVSLKEMKGGLDKKRTMLIGAGHGGSMAIKEFASSRDSRNAVVCIIDDDKNKHGRRVRGVKIVGGREAIQEAAKRYKVEEIVFCIPSAPAHVRNEILEECSRTGIKLKTLPALSQLANGEISASQLRDVSIDELLGRPQIEVDNSVIAGRIQGKTVLVTGGGGSIGSELCRQIASFAPKALVIFDIYENNAYDIQQELKFRYPMLELEVLIGSVRDKERVDYIFEKYRPDMVCHAAAHKHVPLMEDSPAETIKNNVFGTYNVAQAAGEYGTGLFILVSSDKAVNPTNVMGASKRVCEMIVQSMNSLYDTEYIAVRFGNVIGSNGSVIPLFKKQIEMGGPVTVTDKRVTRYFMTIPEAVSLILQAGTFAEGGEVFVLDMGEPVCIDDMARKMIRLSGLEPDVDIEIKYTGLRPGEKLYEELLLQAEGMQKTANDLIYIGRQRMYTPDEIDEKLAILKDVIYAPKEQVRECILSVIQEPEDKSYKVIAAEQESAAKV